MLITRTSPLNGKTRTLDLDVTEEQMDAWQNKGVVIQKAMPHLNPSQREFIMTGIYEEEWDIMFGHEDEGNTEEDDDAPY